MWKTIINWVAVAAMIVAGHVGIFWMIETESNPWWFVAVVLSLLVVAAARHSWKAAVAFMLATAAGFVAGAACFAAWFRFAEVEPFRFFNSKDTGPLGIFLFVLLPGVLAFLATIWRLRTLLNHDEVQA